VPIANINGSHAADVEGIDGGARGEELAHGVGVEAEHRQMQCGHVSELDHSVLDRPCGSTDTASTFERRARSVLTSAGFPLAAAPCSAVPMGPPGGGGRVGAVREQQVDHVRVVHRGSGNQGSDPIPSATLTPAPFASSWRTTSTVPCPEAATMSGVRPI
jgi:hypothetical protein